MSKTRVMLLVDWFWPGYRAGGPIRSCVNLVRWLKDECEFSIITTNRDHLSDTPYQEVRTNEWNTVLDGVRVYYADPDTLTSAKLKALLEAESFDVLALNSMFSKPFTQWPLRMYGRRNNAFRIVLAPRGMLAPGALSVKPLKKQVFLRAFKLMGYPKRLEFQATGEPEAADIRRVFGKKARIFLAPNLPEPELPPLTVREKGNRPTRFVSVARISPEKNNKFLIERLAALRGPAEVKLYGPVGNAAYWESCQAAIAALPGHVKVTHEGEIARDRIGAALQDADFFLLSTLGENFGHAIFESLGAGCPVLISDTTPWKGLEAAQAGWEIPLADTAEWERLLNLACDLKGPEYLRLSQGAYAFAGDFLRDNSLLQRNIDLFCRRK